jgi:hypothetical protein
MTVEVAVADFLEFIKRKKRPNTLKRYRAVMGHSRDFFKPHRVISAIEPADIDAFRDERLGQSKCRLLVQRDHLRLADHSHERSDPLRQLRSDVACWSTAATRAIAIRIRRA